MRELPDGPWTIAQGSYDGQPMLVRINTGAQSIAGDPALAHRIGVAVPLREPDASGFPSAHEGAALGEIEDALDTALRRDARVVSLLVITLGGMREFVYHTDTPATVNEKLAIVQAQFPQHELQLLQAYDPEWGVYRQFTDE